MVFNAAWRRLNLNEKLPRYLGIDLGTGGLTVGLFDPQLNIIEATASGEYGHLGERQNPDWLEQDPDAWLIALRRSMGELREHCPFDQYEVQGIGISGHMHAAIFADGHGNVLHHGDEVPVGAIMWNDPRGEAEAQFLSELWSEPIPLRLTASRIRWLAHNRPGLWAATRMVMVPSAFLGFHLTGILGVGAGDGSGMWGQLDEGLTLREGKLAEIDPLLPLRAIPAIGQAGQVLGRLTEEGASILGMPQGIPVAFPEGDQPVGMVASGVVVPGSGSISLGNSVVSNYVSTSPVLDKRGLVDSFRTADGQHLLMTCVTSGCGVLDGMVKMFASASQCSEQEMRARLDNAAADCSDGSLGITFVPFLGGEGVFRAPNANGMLLGLTHRNMNAGALVRAFYEASAAMMKIGHTHMGAPEINELIVSGGGSQSKAWPRIIALTFDKPVRFPQNASEAAARGAAYLAVMAADSLEGRTQTLREVVGRFVRTSDAILPEPEGAVLSIRAQRFPKVVDGVLRLQRDLAAL